MTNAIAHSPEKIAFIWDLSFPRGDRAKFSTKPLAQAKAASFPFAAIIELKKEKIILINDKPKIGAEGFKIVFIHPKSTGGVLVELAEKPS